MVFKKSLVALITLFMTQSIAAHSMQGIQLSIKFDNEPATRNFASGFANKETAEPMDISKHAMQIGSTTKSFIAATLLLLEADSEQHKLPVTFNLDQTIGEWLPEYPKYAHIKIRSLLNMTSGIYNYTENPDLFNTMASEPASVFSGDALIQLAYRHAPYFQEGEGYHYSNTNYTLAGLIIERVTGQPLQLVLTERIIHRFPKQLAHTEYKPVTYPEGLKMKMAHGYSEDPLNHSMFFGKDITDYSLTWAGSAGAFTSTSEDLANWTEILFTGQLVEKNKLKEMLKLVCIQAEDGCKPGEPLERNSQAYGYGLGIGHLYDPAYGDIWTHNGGTLGFSTTFMRIPAKKMSIAIIINRIAPEIADSDGDLEDEKMLVLEKVMDKLVQAER